MDRRDLLGDLELRGGEEPNGWGLDGPSRQRQDQARQAGVQSLTSEAAPAVLEEVRRWVQTFIL